MTSSIPTRINEDAQTGECDTRPALHGRFGARWIRDNFFRAEVCSGCLVTHSAHLGPATRNAQPTLTHRAPGASQPQAGDRVALQRVIVPPVELHHCV